MAVRVADRRAAWKKDLNFKNNYSSLRELTFCSAAAIVVLLVIVRVPARPDAQDAPRHMAKVVGDLK